MPTYTGFCFGTGETSTMKKKNIISQFSSACTSEKFVREGPGLLGKEVTPNAKRSMRDIVDWLLKQEGHKNTLNLTGFSRGAVTCIEIANRLKKLELALEKRKSRLTSDRKKILQQLKNLEINIFAMDPVAGMGDKGVMDRRVIPDHVKNYVAVLQTDEMRVDFKPQDMTRTIISSKDTKVSMLPMYGNHSDNTKVKNRKMESGANIMWHALYQFLTQHGTTFEEGKMPRMVVNGFKKSADLYSNMTPFSPGTQSKAMLRLFNQHHQERGAYLKSGKKFKFVDGMPVPRDIRSLNKHLDFYVKNPDFFVNQLERDLFKVSYPKVFNYLFEQNQEDPHFPDDSHSEKAAVLKELIQLKEEDPELLTRLHHRGVGLDAHQNLTLGEPGGVFCIEPCLTLRQMFPHLLPDSAKIEDPEIAKLSMLDNDVHRLVLKYAREKSELFAFTPRRQLDEAQALSMDVKSIIESEPGSAKNKYEKALNKVEEYYQRFILSQSASELPQMLSELLEKHHYVYQVKESSSIRVLMANFVQAMLNLLQEAVRFVFNLGHLGGGVLSFIGTALQDLGRRCNDFIGTVGKNPLKGVASVIAYAIEGVGFSIKNSFGLKPLGNLIASSIAHMSNEAVKAIGPVKIEKIDPTARYKHMKRELAEVKRELEPMMSLSSDKLKLSVDN